MDPLILQLAISLVALLNIKAQTASGTPISGTQLDAEKQRTADLLLQAHALLTKAP